MGYFSKSRASFADNPDGRSIAGDVGRFPAGGLPMKCERNSGISSGGARAAAV